MKNTSLLLIKIAISASWLIKMMAIFSANSASPLGGYQPVEPKEMRKFKK